eukprot:SAG25_NODE_15_length_24441_cov_175.207288_19_plen_62_part_00
MTAAGSSHRTACRRLPRNTTAAVPAAAAAAAAAAAVAVAVPTTDVSVSRVCSSMATLVVHV